MHCSCLKQGDQIACVSKFVDGEEHVRQAIVLNGSTGVVEFKPSQKGIDVSIVTLKEFINENKTGLLRVEYLSYHDLPGDIVSSKVNQLIGIGPVDQKEDEPLTNFEQLIIKCKTGKFISCSGLEQFRECLKTPRQIFSLKYNSDFY